VEDTLGLKKGVNMLKSDQKAQVTMELAMATIGVVILLVGCINTFIWLGTVMAERQNIYDRYRPDAASVSPFSATPQEMPVDENWLPVLNTME
jgi:hypothetical protein